MQKAFTYAQIIGYVIRIKRERSSITLEAMAKEMGFSTRSGWSRVESGDTTITAAQLYRAARALTCTPSTIVQEADKLVAQLRDSGVDILDEKPKNKMPWGVVGTAAVLTFLAGAGAVAATKKQRDDEDE